MAQANSSDSEAESDGQPMNFPCDHIAFDQAGAAFAGWERLRPQDDYSPIEMNRVDVFSLARVLAGPGPIADFRLSEWSGELDPERPIRVLLDNVVFGRKL